MKLRGYIAGERFRIKLFFFLFLSLLAVTLTFTINAILIPESAVEIKWTLFLQSVLCFAVPAMFLAYLFEHDEIAVVLKLKRFPNPRLIVLTIASVIVVYPVITLLGLLNQEIPMPDIFIQMEEASEALTVKLLSGDNPVDLILNLLFIAVVPALTEELYFRGLTQQFVGKRMGTKWAIWVVAVFFSAYHMQFLGFFPRVLLGAYLGYLLYWSESIWLPIIAHFTNNAFAVVLFFLFQKQMLEMENTTLADLPKSFYIGAVMSLLVFMALMFSIRKNARNSLGPSSSFLH